MNRIGSEEQNTKQWSYYAMSWMSATYARNDILWRKPYSIGLSGSTLLQYLSLLCIFISFSFSIRITSTFPLVIQTNSLRGVNSTSHIRGKLEIWPLLSICQPQVAATQLSLMEAPLSKCSHTVRTRPCRHLSSPLDQVPSPLLPQHHPPLLEKLPFQQSLFSHYTP